MLLTCGTGYEMAIGSGRNTKRQSMHNSNVLALYQQLDYQPNIANATTIEIGTNL
jgi:hypothetical protein